jgi:hypothetical protein
MIDKNLHDPVIMTLYPAFAGNQEIAELTVKGVRYLKIWKELLLS